MFVQRGYVLNSCERVLARELPTCCAGENVIGRADLLAFDTEHMQPVLVELKRGDADDPLSSVMLELLSHWVFHTRHLSWFEDLIAEFGFCAAHPMRLVIAAPEWYFDQTRARSQRSSRRNREFDKAVSWIESLSHTVRIDLYAVEDQWQITGPAFGMRRLTP